VSEASVFFFEKKNQKTFAKWAPLSPERPKPKKSKVFCFFFSKKKSFLLRAFSYRELPGQYKKRTKNSCSLGCGFRLDWMPTFKNPGRE
jgi:hypothetical protein